MLNTIFEHLQNDELIPIKNIFEQYDGHYMGFVTNESEGLVVRDGQEDVKMVEWSLLEVAVALKANRVANWLMKQSTTLIINRIDVGNPDLELDQSPNMVEDADVLLDLEVRPLRAAIIAQDYPMLNVLWRRSLTWEPCHFYRIIELLLQRNDTTGLDRLLSPQNHFINQFYDPKVLQAILTE